MLRHLILPSIIPHNACLIEGILLALLKFLPTDLLPLLLPQPRMLEFDLRQPPLLKRFVRSLEPSLRVTVDLL